MSDEEEEDKLNDEETGTEEAKETEKTGQAGGEEKAEEIQTLPEPVSGDLPDDLKRVLTPLKIAPLDAEETKTAGQAQEKPKQASTLKVADWQEKLPPQEFFEWLIRTYPGSFKKPEEDILLIRSIYEANPNTTKSAFFKKYNTNRNHVKYRLDKLNKLYNQLKDEFEASKNDEISKNEEKAQSAERGSKPAERLEPETVETQPATRRGKGRRTAGSGGDEKVTKDMLSASKATTTFREIDKTIASLLGVEFHDAAIKKNVYARLGELLIYTLLQLGAIDRDKIVEYSQMLVDDPDALYFYVKEQLDSVIKVTDPDTLQKVWLENAGLRRAVMAYEATGDMLSSTLDYYAQAIRALMSLLNKKQLEKFVTWIYVSEYMRNIRRRKQAFVGGGLSGAGIGA